MCVVSRGSERQASGTKVSPGKCKDGKVCRSRSRSGKEDISV